MTNKEKIVELRKTGLTYVKIAEKLKLNSLYVSKVANGVLTKDQIKLARQERQCKGEYRICKECCVKFYAKPSLIRRGLGECCGKSCAAKLRNYTKNINKTEYFDRGWASIRAKRDQKKCSVCEFDIVLDAHHIDEDPQNNNINNLIVLCPNHHAMIHRGKAIVKNGKYLML